MAGGGRRRHLSQAARAGAGRARALHRVRQLSGPWTARDVRARFGTEGRGDAAGSGVVADGRRLYPTLPDVRNHRAAGRSAERDEEVGLTSLLRRLRGLVGTAIVWAGARSEERRVGKERRA